MREAGKQEKKYRIDALLLMLLVLIPFLVKAQADLRTDNYIQVKNNWEDTARLTKSIQLKVLKKYGLNKYGLDEISFIYTAAQDGGVAVFSDIYYPLGWKAFIDGKEVPIVKANYVLRALRLPKGTNKIISFQFNPETFAFGNKFALLGSALFYLLLAACVYFIFKKETPTTK